jgi:hypothetical protein
MMGQFETLVGSHPFGRPSRQFEFEINEVADDSHVGRRHVATQNQSIVDWCWHLGMFRLARTLLGWGIWHFTILDYETVSYSNPVRQNLFTLDDCHYNNGAGKPKAQAVAGALKAITVLICADQDNWFKMYSTFYYLIVFKLDVSMFVKNCYQLIRVKYSALRLVKF